MTSSTAPAPATPATNEQTPGSAGPGPAKEPMISRLVGKPWFWVLLIFVIIVGPVSRAFLHGVPRPPEMSIPLPAFTLTSERGTPFGTADLRGKVWVADFVFTSCPTVCPKLTARMAEIQRRSRHLGDAFHLVTISVDPENDTPEKLAAYAKVNKADPLRWTFLTGSLDAIEGTVVKGFKMAMGKEETAPGSGLFSIFHGERLVLVDQDGNLRGYYEADDEGIAKLLRDAGIVANRLGLR
ncbi:MAG: SCO family protein [Byssovorax sp.]